MFFVNSMFEYLSYKSVCERKVEWAYYSEHNVHRETDLQL